jgi:two-component system LytT family sensor kinase
MIKDVSAKFLLIPLLGLLVPVLTSFFACNNCTVSQIFFSALSYILITFLLWQGVVAITAFIRNNAHIRKTILVKVLLLISCTVLFSIFCISLFVAFLKTVFSNVIQYENIPVYTFSYFVLAPLISLTYEILFLHKEQELDSKIVAQLDYERQSAELNVLKSELDPHFIFNAFNTLAPLIVADPGKAQDFTIRLAQTYKYLLLNKDRELISLCEELRFIEDYFFLLRIRHEGKLRLHTELDGTTPHKIMILPFSLQVLVENAIKHNGFSEEAPLVITISIKKQFIEVTNTIQTKSFGVESTHVGLKNLSARYKLTCRRDITIEQTQNHFIVKLPVIKTTV